jgi:hypothetical protein
MPKTSVKTFLSLVHKLNEDMDNLATNGLDIVKRINEIDFDSITGPSEEEEMKILYNNVGDNFRKLNDMKQTLMGGLQRKVIQEMNMSTPSSKVKSLTLNRKSKQRSRTTRRIRSI